MLNYLLDMPVTEYHETVMDTVNKNLFEVKVLESGVNPAWMQMLIFRVGGYLDYAYIEGVPMEQARDMVFNKFLPHSITEIQRVEAEHSDEG